MSESSRRIDENRSLLTPDFFFRLEEMRNLSHFRTLHYNKVQYTKVLSKIGKFLPSKSPKPSEVAHPDEVLKALYQVSGKGRPCWIQL